MRRLAAALCLCALLPATARAQGVYMESVEVQKGEDPAVVATDPAKVTKTSAAPGKYRVDMAKGTVSIFRHDKKALYLLDTAAKTYSETSLEELKGQMQAASETIDAAQAEMQKQLAKLPPEQRKMVEEQMRGAFPKAKPAAKPLKVVETGETKTICGYACKRFAVRDGEEEVLSAWVTTDIPEMKAMRKDWEEMMDAMASLAATFGGRSAEAFRKLDGFPLESEQLGVHTVTTKVERKEIPDSEFEVPEGYTLEASPFAAMAGAKAKAKAKPKAVGAKKVVPKVVVPPEVTPPAPKAALKFCSGCGAKLGAGAKFCSSCGKKVGE